MHKANLILRKGGQFLIAARKRLYGQRMQIFDIGEFRFEH